MDVIGAMKARRSVRSYLPRKVEQEKLNAVLEAVRLTPSRHNDQNIRVIVVRDSALKQQLRQQAETQPMVEEAAEQGLDTCIICAFREDAVKDLLHVPASARVVSMVALGYGADNSPRKTKKNMEEIVSYDRF